MTAEFNMNVLDTFNKAVFDNENVIVNFAGKENEKAASLKRNGTFSGSNIFRFMRGGKAQKANNEARSELLKSLGKAFGLEGVGTGKRGETTFSREFMDKLKNLIGPAFKAEDFGVPEQGGAVTSGKPLTFRRVKAIMTQAANFSSGNKFDLTEYQNKFNNLLKESGSSVATLDADIKNAKTQEQESFLEMFRFVKASLDFLDTEINDPEKSVVRNNPIYQEELEDEGAGSASLNNIEPFIVYDKETGKTSYVHVLDEKFRSTVFSKAVGGLAIHTENCQYKFTDKDGNTYYDISDQKKYVTDLMKSFIKVSVDSFYKAKMTGRLNEFRNHIATNGGACMEDKTTKFIEFRDRKLDQAKPVDKDLERELEGIVLKGTNATPLDECVTGMINNVVSREDLQDLDSWEEYAPHVRKELVGTFHPITKPVLDSKGNPVKIYGKFQFEPVMVNGQPEFRKLTEEDVDRIGKMIYDDAFKF